MLIGLEPGQELGQHQVKENAFLVVVEGDVVIDSGGSSLDAGPGTLVAFAPDERHSVSSAGGARILLLLSPWPGEGHYRAEEMAARPRLGRAADASAAPHRSAVGSAGTSSGRSGS